VPCGFYIWNHSSTTVVKGQTFQDWFINDYILNKVGRSPLVSGFFWDDVWNPECNIHDQVKNTCEDMGFSKGDPRLVQLTADYQANMKALREATLKAGKFAWQMLWTGGADDSIGRTGLTTLVTKDTCTQKLRTMCDANSPAQTRAMAYGLSGGDTSKRNPEFSQDLANFLLTRGKYSFLGWGWKGCSKEYHFPKELNYDYGVPVGVANGDGLGLCKETAPGSEIFVREYTKSTVVMDCTVYVATISMHDE
jgi:hypothetical protein|tara:strand:+ start:113 stop:865 length:753 start_codon:yes stop_codon:yes gene_type:complete